MVKMILLEELGVKCLSKIGLLQGRAKKAPAKIGEESPVWANRLGIGCLGTRSFLHENLRDKVRDKTSQIGKNVRDRTSQNPTVSLTK